SSTTTIAATVYRATTMTAGSAAPSAFGSMLSVREKLMPSIKASLVSLSPPSSPKANGSKSASFVLGSDALTEAKTDGRVMFVPLPPIGGVLAENIVNGVVHNRWLSNELRAL